MGGSFKAVSDTGRASQTGVGEKWKRKQRNWNYWYLKVQAAQDSASGVAGVHKKSLGGLIPWNVLIVREGWKSSVSSTNLRLSVRYSNIWICGAYRNNPARRRKTGLPYHNIIHVLLSGNKTIFLMTAGQATRNRISLSIDCPTHFDTFLCLQPGSVTGAILIIKNRYQ